MKARSFLLPSLLLVCAAPAGAQLGDPTKVNLRTSAVAGGISVIDGADGFAGGNVGVLVGEDGLVLIDDALQPLTAKLKARLAALSSKPVRFVINTHWHADHTGGNPAFGSSATLIAHDSVRAKLSVDNTLTFHGQTMTVKALPPEGLPIVTFGEDVTLHLDGEEIHAFHVPPAHTAGDVIVHFKKANVLHAGDTFTPGGYPIVDTSSGGRFDGFITAAERLLPLCNDTTRIIPGHGPVSGRADLVAWHDMLVKVHDRVAKLVAGKKTLEQVKAAKPSAEFDARYGKGMIDPDQLVAWAYESARTAGGGGGGKKHAP